MVVVVAVVVGMVVVGMVVVVIFALKSSDDAHGAKFWQRTLEFPHNPKIEGKSDLIM